MRLLDHLFDLLPAMVLFSFILATNAFVIDFGY